MKKILIHSINTSENSVEPQEATILACNDGYVVFSGDSVIHYDTVNELCIELGDFIITYLKSSK